MGPFGCFADRKETQSGLRAAADPARMKCEHGRQLEALGYKVDLESAA